MLMLNGKEVHLDNPLPDVNAYRLLALARPGVNVFLATGEEERLNRTSVGLKGAHRTPGLGQRTEASIEPAWD